MSTLKGGSVAVVHISKLIGDPLDYTCIFSAAGDLRMQELSDLPRKGSPPAPRSGK